MKLQIKEEFKNLIPDLSDEEFKGLEISCIKEGIRDAIIVYNSFIIDGHNRYSIALKNNLEYNTLEKEFDSDDDVKEWMINNQFDRRNINAYQRSVLALKLEDLFKEKAKENLGKNQYSSLPTLAKPSIDTRKEISLKANVSHGTIDKVKRIEREANNEVKQKLITGEISINKAYTDIVMVEMSKDLREIEINKKIEKSENPQFSEYGENMYFISNSITNRWDDHIIKDGDKWPTITTLSRFFHNDNQEYGLREYARVQEFPDSFKFAGTYSSIKRQIGNAVSPTMGKFITSKLKGKTSGDLFAGCGGFSCGAEMNGIKSKWAIEWNKTAIATYKLNFDANTFNQNINLLDPSDFEKVDIIIGGPPCQGFSNAGLMFKDDPRNELYKEYLRFVNIIKPDEFIMENVPQIENIKDQIIKDFNNIGYNVETKLIKGIDIGMRQIRKRFFFLGTKI